MAQQLRLRRGTKAQHEVFTGALGEATANTTEGRIHLHDGITPGGNATLMESDALTSFAPDTVPLRGAAATDDEGTSQFAAPKLPNHPLRPTEGIYSVASIADLANIPSGLLVDGARFDVTSFWPGLNLGGGRFVWSSAQGKSGHNGITVIDPDKLSELGIVGVFGNYFTPAGSGTGCFIRLWASALQESMLSPFWAGCLGDQGTDDTIPLQETINLGTLQGYAIGLGRAKYRTTAPLTIPQNPAPGGAYGVRIQGLNTNWTSISEIFGDHTGAAILNLKGANGCTIKGVKLLSGPTAFPRCALVLGRDSNVDSCGWHNLSEIFIDGHFSHAAIYSIASEENYWSDIFVQLRGGGAKYGFYTGVSDALAVDSLPTSTNLANTVRKMNIWQWEGAADHSSIYIEGAQAVGSWSFIDCYCIPKGGSYYTISNGAIDGLPMLGPVSFINCSGEIYAPVDPFTDTPLYAFNLKSAGNISLKGLTISGGRCQLINAGGLRKILNVGPNLALIKPNIFIPELEDPTTGVSVVRNKVSGGSFEVANSSDWTALPLSGWVNNFGSPYPSAAYRVDSAGVLHFRGIINNSSSGPGPIAQLPPGFEPSFTNFLSTIDSGSAAKLTLSNTGLLSLTTGAGTELLLNGVSLQLRSDT
jgi:hypothetical protein